MNATEIQEFAKSLDQLREAYENYRSIQEKEHSHLSRRGSISEWNTLVREKDAAMQMARKIETEMAPTRKHWIEMGEWRTRVEFQAIRDKISQLQTLLTRILTCDRMNETLLYNSGYIQSVVAYRSSLSSENSMFSHPTP